MIGRKPIWLSTYRSSWGSGGFRERLEKLPVSIRAINHIEAYDLIARLSQALKARTTVGTVFPHDLNPALLDEEARGLLKTYEELINHAQELLACEHAATQRQIAHLSQELRRALS